MHEETEARREEMRRKRDEMTGRYGHTLDCFYYEGRDKVLCVFGSIIACAGTASDVSERFLHALDWSDGGS
jgi:hypothetical protein